MNFSYSIYYLSKLECQRIRILYLLNIISDIVFWAATAILYLAIKHTSIRRFQKYNYTIYALILIRLAYAFNLLIMDEGMTEEDSTDCKLTNNEKIKKILFYLIENLFYVITVGTVHYLISILTSIFISEIRYQGITKHFTQQGCKGITHNMIIINQKYYNTFMFKGIYFMFPVPTVSLTHKRIQTLMALIEKNGGELVLTAKTLMICGADASMELCQKQIGKFNLDFESYRTQFINSDWISQSLLKQKLQDLKKYQLFPNTELQIIQTDVEQTKPTLVYIESIGQTVAIQSEQLIDENQESYDNTIQIPDFLTKFQNRRRQFIEETVKEYRVLLDYEYDNDLDNFHNQVDDGFEFLLDEFIFKKEEHIPENEKFYGDEDCQITETRKVAYDVLEGLNLGNSIVNPDQQIQNAQIKETKQFNPGLKRKAQFWESRKGYFVCEAGSAQKSFNDEIIAELEKLLKIYTNEKDKGRCIAYRKAIGFLKSLSFPIKSEEDLKDMPTIGEKIKKKIIEIIQTGKLTKVQKLQGQEKNIAISELSRVWGIGPTTAASFYFQGLKTLDDLKKNQHLLNKNQQVCLYLVEELEQRIPRDEATLIYEIVKREIDELSGVQGLYKATACGSYRREKETCGDMDILITRCDGKSSEGFLTALIKRLEGKLLTHHLTTPKRSENDTETYMGIGKISNQAIHRRIDLKLYPKEQYGCAVLYFTGSDHYNRSMRLWAQKNGYTLSDHGLYPTQRGAHNKKLWKGEVIPCEEEIDVYRILGLTYKPPKDRSV